MLRAAYFDADGTLVSFRTHGVPQDAMVALARMRAAGIKCILCTGRNGSTADALLHSGLFDGAILLNGQLCLLDGETLYSRPIDREDLLAAVEGAEQGDFTLGFVSGWQNFMNRYNAEVWLSDEHGGMPEMHQAEPRRALDMEIYQMHFYGAPGEEDALIRRTKGLRSARWLEYFADVFPADGGKDKGMAVINAHLGLDRSETIAFGDGENDIGMLRYAGVGVAMGNASDLVKAQADFVTSSVDEGGIARAVEHFAGEMGL